MKEIQKADFIAEIGEEIVFTEDCVVSMIIPYDPNHISMRVFEDYELMNDWVNKEFPSGNFKLEQKYPSFLWEITELNQ